MNYLRHTEELEGRSWRPSEPVIFLKADSALLNQGKPFFVPDWSERVDYEAELVVRICRLGKGIPQRFAHRYYDAVTVGIDFTARDMQQQARGEGLPWTICKGFDGSAVVGQFVPIPPVTENGGLHFHLDVDRRCSRVIVPTCCTPSTSSSLISRDSLLCAQATLSSLVHLPGWGLSASATILKAIWKRSACWTFIVADGNKMGISDVIL